MSSRTKAPPVQRASKRAAAGVDADAKSLRIARILVPTDFSEESKGAIRYATRLAETFGASIHLAYVIDSLGDLKDAEVVPWNADSAQATVVMQRKLAELANEQIGELVPVYPHVVASQAVKGIIALARSSSCDLITISTQGHTGVRRALIGSVAERVVRHAHCPVLVVRTQERDFA